MRALLLGATGLVGSQVLSQLLAEPSYSEVRVLLRRPPAAGFAEASKKLSAQVVDFERLEAAPDSLWATDHIYCCLGTTIRQAGSQKAFRRVDFDYVKTAAERGAKARVSKFLLISSVGANSRARGFYLRVKGETEAAVQRAGIAEVHAFRPSLLLGHRAGSRPLEQFSIALSKGIAPLLAGPLAIYRPIEASALARAMIKQGLAERKPGFWIQQGSDLRA